MTGLSFDLGKETTAVTVWNGSSLQKMQPSKLMTRSFSQYRSLGEVMSRWELWIQGVVFPLAAGLSLHKLAFIAYEETFPRSKYAAEIRYAMTGLLLKLAYEREVPAHAIVTTVMKKYVTGIGNADKDQTIAAIKQRYPGIDRLRADPMLDGITHDEADSIAVGETLLAMLRGETVIPVKVKGKSKLKVKTSKNSSKNNNRKKAA